MDGHQLEEQLRPPNSRKTTEIFGLGAGVTEFDADITGTRLPTNRQVLRCLMYYIESGFSINRTKIQAAQIVLERVKVFYDKGNVPMIQDISACKKLVKLLDVNSKFREIPVSRSNPSILTKLQQNENDLSNTCPLWSPQAESTMRHTEDVKFL